MKYFHHLIRVVTFITIAEYTLARTMDDATDAPFHLKVASPLPSPYVVQPWKKLLYLRQAYPDNYTDPLFLSQLKRNTTVAKYRYSNVVGDFLLIVLHILALILVVLMFSGIYLFHWDIRWPTAATTLVSLVGLFGFHRHQIKSYVITLMLLLVLSPVLRLLTRLTALDLIWALSFCLVIANTIFHDYAFGGDPHDYHPIISTNISLTNAIVLALRLNTHALVFTFLMFAIEVLILWPLFDVSMRHWHWHKLHRTLFASLFGIDCWLIWRIMGGKYVGFWIVGCGAIMFGLPAYFLFLQKYKNEMMGPWDPAKPKLNRVQ